MVEQRSPKPTVEGSSPSAPANALRPRLGVFLFLYPPFVPSFSIFPILFPLKRHSQSAPLSPPDKVPRVQKRIMAYGCSGGLSLCGQLVTTLSVWRCWGYQFGRSKGAGDAQVDLPLSQRLSLGE